MAIVITGNPSDITTPLTSAVASLSSGVGGVVRVATVGPHLSATGDVVQITTTVISGTFSITVIDGTHYDLTGTTFTSTSTGNVSNCSLTPQIQFPTDGDTQSMQLSGLLSGLRALASRTQYLATRAVAIEKSAIFLSSGTWVAPTNLVVQNGTAVVHLFAAGGGGCGGGGPGGGISVGWSSPGGGGGAGAQPVVAFVSDISPGASYTVTIGGSSGAGAGGTGSQAAGPTAATPGGQGANGTDTTLFLGAVQVARAPGGQGGSGGSALRTGPVSPGGVMATFGGSGPSRPDNLYPYRFDGTGISPIPPMPPWAFGPGNGGPGFTSNAANLIAISGVPSSNGWSGGATGSLGAVSGTTLGGGYGGGGGGGGGSVGGVGGSGGAGNNAGNGGNGVAATGGTLGGGGGGGGAGGEANAGNNGGNGGAGAVGGDGFLLITWYEYDVVPGV